jgi:hypothetical protein
MGPQETTGANKISFYRASRYTFGNLSSTDALRNEPKGMVLRVSQNAVGQGMLSNYVVK